ncbi:MAG: prolyl-tRNA synthetase associated domain-containing protein [Leptolinea sp.]|jgi:Ala-tRNA(Pro) deacylase|nr:prolyl-tRNA synthetase associated domain-containing protein [Leptolinea sp.]
MPISSEETKILQTLEDLQIPYQRYEHPPVATVKEAEQYSDLHPGAHCRNLFLRDKPGKKHYLVILRIETEVNLNKLARAFKSGRLSFASNERLYRFLGVLPGAVSPFGLVHDIDHEVMVILDHTILEADTAGFHPNVNTATIVVKVTDLLHFLDVMGNNYQVIDFTREDIS